MKILLIGSGGREHALAWKMAQSPQVQKVFVAPGNGGTAMAKQTHAGIENLPITDLQGLADFAKREQIHLTVVGPEAPLAAGIVDVFRNAGFVISTVLLRVSLSTPKPYDLLLGLIAMLYGLMVLSVFAGYSWIERSRAAESGEGVSESDS